MTGPTTDFTEHEKDQALAAEYVMGLLDLAERSFVDQRVKADAAFAATVKAWEQRLAPLNDSYDDVTPSAAVLQKLEGRLFPAAPKRRLWAGWLLGGALAAMVALGVTMPQLVGFGPTPVAAVLATEDDSLRYEAVFDGTDLVVTRAAGKAAASGQVHELWIIAPNAAPVSLGLLADAPLRVAYPIPPNGWVLAITLEPEGGGPGGVPTGPVILKTELEI